MKKILLLILVSLLVVSCAFAGVREKREKLEKINKYVKVLDQKIEAARQARQINKIAELKEMKRAQQERANRIRSEISSMPGGGRGWQVVGGLGGGAVIVDFGYNIPMDKFDLLVGLGYGLGNSYSILKGSVASVFNTSPMYWGLEAVGANYSKSVTGVTGLSGTIAKGTKLGLGLFVGKAINEKISGQIGYNSALGATAAVSYKL